LVELKSDCPIEVSREALTYRGRDAEKLRALYTELGFTRMLGLLNSDALPSPGASASAAASTPASESATAGTAAGAAAGAARTEMTQIGLPLGGPLPSKTPAVAVSAAAATTISADYGTLFTAKEIAEFAEALRREGEAGVE